MSLEELAQAVEQKGFSRQAVLLRSRAGNGYVNALLQPQWRARVEEAVGKEIYVQLERCQNTLAQKLLQDIFGGQAPATPYFQPREYTVTPLEVTLETLFDFSVLQRAAEITKQATELQAHAHSLVYGEVQERARKDDDLLYEIYKDADPVSEQMGEDQLQRLRWEYHRRLSARTEQLKILAQLNAPLPLLTNQIRMLSENVPPFACAEGSAFQQETRQLIDSLVERHADQEEWRGAEEKMRVRDLTSSLIEEGKRLLDNEQKRETAFRQWLAKEQLTLRWRVLKRAKEKLTFLIEDLTPCDQLHPFSEHNLLGSVEATIREESTSEELLWQLYKSSLSKREEFLAWEYAPAVRSYFDLLVGLQQLLDGGPVTNPNASPVSVLQNHYRFPNIQYLPETMSSIQQILPKLKSLLDELPDISDLATSTKMRKKKEHIYIIEELPKDPLDITFGNDSGCCVFVPEKLEELQNGVAVVEWLLNPSIRLFGIYRQEGEKKQRMGLVPAFETGRRKQGRVLACNSVELSRFGISGGNQTIQKVVDHVENYLAGYAKEFGYRGCTMGRHSYNTSANFSRKIGDIVDEELRFIQRGKRFYSDIFQWDEQARVMRTRPKSCYELWKK